VILATSNFESFKPEAEVLAKNMEVRKPFELGDMNPKLKLISYEDKYDDNNEEKNK
jgi:hypothetical protein